MNTTKALAALILLSVLCASASARQAVPAGDPIGAMVGQLDLERYKAVIKGLTGFGDRRQGTDRNRAAIDWIESQLKSYGCPEVQRLTYTLPLPQQTGVVPAGAAQSDDAERMANAAANSLLWLGNIVSLEGRRRGIVAPAGVNRDPSRQRDLELRELNSQPPTPGPSQEVYCTKFGVANPGEMYIVGAHMDGIGYGEAADDDASGTALVMELARIFSNPDIQTDRSIRFILWNEEEQGTWGSRAYVAQREALQGKEIPPGSGYYPEPKWLGMIQHDMMLFDHGMPRADGTVSKEQRPEADINIEFSNYSAFAGQSLALALAFQAANENYATDYPATVGRHMTNTDSRSFENIVAAISLRENERGTQIGNGWNPHWHQATDVYSTYSDRDFLLGLNAAQTTLSAIAQLTGARLKK